MKPLKTRLGVMILAISLFSCSHYQQKYPYAIADFDVTLQPHLIQQVNIGIFKRRYIEKYIQDSVTEKELLKLSVSEIPILRASALTALLHKPGVNTFDIVKNHLDDTAYVMFSNYDEPIYKIMVTDYMLFGVKKVSPVEGARSLEEDILLHHNYLGYAYGLLSSVVDTPGKYYSVIREMAFQDRPFSEVEPALFALSKYSIPQDMTPIASLLAIPENNRQMGELSFDLLGNSPNNAYWHVLEQYYIKTAKYYEGIMDDCGGHAANITSFYESVGLYKNMESAKILGEMLDRDVRYRQQSTLFLDGDKEYLLHLLEDDSCSAYQPLLTRYRKDMYWIKQGVGQ